MRTFFSSLAVLGATSAPAFAQQSVGDAFVGAAAIVGFFFIVLAIIIVYEIVTGTTSSAANRAKTYKDWPPEKGSQIKLHDGRKEYEYEVLSVGKPENDAGKRLIEVKDVHTGATWLHGVDPDGFISYWGYGT